MSYQVRLDSFEGPMDLLFHLIEENQLDINEISLHKVAQQYLEYIEKMQEMDLDIASEFIVLAAELLQLKARALLPGHRKRKKGPPPEPDLVKRLLYYGKVRRTVKKLRTLEGQRIKMFQRGPDSLIHVLETIEEEQSPPQDPLKGIELKELLKAYENSRLKAQISRRKKTEEKQEVYDFGENISTVDEKMEEIMQVCSKESGNFSFKKLIDNCKNHQEKIVAFLALLELVKNSKIKIRQSKNHNILIRKGEV